MNAPFHRAPGAASPLSATVCNPHPAPALSRIVSNGLRIEVETVRAEAVHVRLRPDFIGPGVTDGPRVALCLALDDARSLAALLHQHAAEVQA